MIISNICEEDTTKITYTNIMGLSIRKSVNDGRLLRISALKKNFVGLDSGVS